MTGLQQHGWQLDAQPQLLAQPPSWFQPKSSYRSACAAVVSDKVATTTLQILIHFMTRSLLPLGFGSWAVCIPARRAGKLLFVGDSPPTWFGGGGRRRRASRCPRSPDRGRAGSRRQNVLDHVGDAILRHRFDTGSLPMSLFQTISVVAPSRSVCEGLEQSIGAT
jgi:hypothetical protein